MSAGRAVWVKIRSSEAERAEWHAKARAHKRAVEVVAHVLGATARRKVTEARLPASAFR